MRHFYTFPFRYARTKATQPTLLSTRVTTLAAFCSLPTRTPTLNSTLNPLGTNLTTTQSFHTTRAAGWVAPWKRRQSPAQPYELVKRHPMVQSESSRGALNYTGRAALLFGMAGCFSVIMLAGLVYSVMDYVGNDMAPVDDRIKNPGRMYLISAAIRDLVLPDTQSALNYLKEASKVLAKSSESDDAKIDSSKEATGTKLEPGDPALIELYLRMGELLDQQGQWMEAFKGYQLVYNAYFNNPKFWAQLAKAYWGEHPTLAFPNSDGQADTTLTTQQHLMKTILATQVGAVLLRTEAYAEAKDYLGKGLQNLQQLDNNLSNSDGNASVWHTWIRQSGRWVRYDIHDLHFLELRLIHTLAEAHALQGDLDTAYTLYKEALNRLTRYRAQRQQALKLGQISLDTIDTVPWHWRLINRYLMREQIALSPFFTPATASQYLSNREQYVPRDQDELPQWQDPRPIDNWACLDAQWMDRLGELSYGLGRREEAERWFQEALTLSDTSDVIPACAACASVVLGHMAVLAEKHCQPREARIYWQSATGKAEEAEDLPRVIYCQSQLDRLRQRPTSQ
ncbi:hypothetical protein IWQ62_000847 [Dispira parvispora]|uniref:Uncharacterized protein n=1 Tax=Dispira parvispora TaxID=1520584 RepID=A0A9W8E981_9FUNG|nr:hypothetical protein IWQ62_000847 [Dispira parvispora]